MVTLRAYSNPAEAAIAKSLLDDHKIFCSLADENVNLYGGGPLAMPIRLLVAEDQAEEAARILTTKGLELSEDFDPGTANETARQKGDINQQILSEVRKIHHMSHWMMLLAISVLIIAVCLVFEIPRRVSPWSRVQQAVRQYDYQRALNLAKDIVREHPEDYYGHEYIGYIYLQMGNLNQAELEYSRAYELAPPDRVKSKLEDVRRRIERSHVFSQAPRQRHDGNLIRLGSSSCHKESENRLLI
jgi:tetratricopeptide (TPR) repeat protein